MKKRFIAGATIAALALSSLAADTEDIKTNAWFDLKTHTTLGYNLQEKIFGMESTIDQAQVWWEFLPYATRGVEESKGDSLSASVRIEGLKYAFKFYNEKKTYEDNNTQGDYNVGDDYKKTTGWRERPGMTDDKDSNYFVYDRIVSEVKWRNLFLNFYKYDYENGCPIGFDNASLKSLFDDFTNFRIFDSAKDDNVGILYYNGIRDSNNYLGRGNYGITGVISAGVRYDKWNATLSAGTPGSWIAISDEAPKNIKQGKAYQKLNAENKAVFQLDTEFLPAENLKVNADILATMNFKKKADDQAAASSIYGDSSDQIPYDIYTGGIGVEYDFDLEKGTLSPYAGFDFRYLKADEKAFNNKKDESDSQFEGGLGIAYYWRGKDFKYNNNTLDYWGRQFPVGVSLGMNSDQNGIANLVFSVYEKPDADALIPNLGGFFEFEMVNLFRTGDKDDKFDGAKDKDWKKDSAFFIAGQLEYLINVPVAKRKTMAVKPYIFGRLIQQRDGDGYLTREYDFDSRVGVTVNPCARFNIDLRYERADVLWDLKGKDNELDKGCLTCRFDVRL